MQGYLHPWTEKLKMREMSPEPAFGPPSEDRPSDFTGYFLCASELLTDPNFFRSTVLIAQQDLQGALGLVINRPTEGRLRDLFSGLQGNPLGDQPFSWGGPVQQDHLFVFRGENPRVPEALPGLRPLPGLVFEPLTQLFFDFLQENPETDHPPYRIFAGYAGWEGGQLDREMDQGAWYWIKGVRDDVFSPRPQDLYREILARKGPIYEIIARTGIRISEN